MTKMKKGDRVRLSGKGCGICISKNWNRLGTVIGTRPLTSNCVVVRWDGLKTNVTMMVEYLELVQPTSAAEAGSSPL